MYIAVMSVGVAFLVLLLLGFFSTSKPFNGICTKCGENLPHYGFTRCPWCQRISLVLWYR